MRIEKDDAVPRPERKLVVDGVEVHIVCWGRGVWPCSIFIDYQPIVVINEGNGLSEEGFHRCRAIADKVATSLQAVGFKVSQSNWGRFRLVINRGLWEGLPKLKEMEEVHGPSFLTTDREKEIVEEAILVELTVRLCPES